MEGKIRQILTTSLPKRTLQHSPAQQSNQWFIQRFFSLEMLKLFSLIFSEHFFVLVWFCFIVLVVLSFLLK